MSVIGELQRYLEHSIDLLATTAHSNLVDALASARPTSSDDLPTSASRILAALEGHEARISQEDALESLERLRAICRIILGR
jgi:hypothetical protein